MSNRPRRSTPHPRAQTTADPGLIAALVNMATTDRQRPPCGDHDTHNLWTSELAAERAQAATRCRPCPVLDECRTAGEAERDSLAGRLESLQRAEVERVAGRHLDRPAGLWAGGAKLEDLVDESGNVDAGKVTAAATRAADELGLRTPPPRGYVPREGHNPRPPQSAGARWADLLKAPTDE